MAAFVQCRRGNIFSMMSGHVRSYLSLRPEMDQSLDDVVARDLAKGDRWMNLQWEIECGT
ncbi:hypothetical protein C1H46_011138 [Malus baccata]|uniref:DUF4378 domain-containing protein n=1 Tax=Malus baccata TaxID=106549 RepID=A0A540MWT4_MALBA|nr:hypothetical protein C1H46_011138 [Malus baccata]